MDSVLEQWWSSLAQVANGAFSAAIVFTCLSLIVYRKDLKAALKIVLPSSLRFNLIILAFDSLLVLVPLSYLASLMQQLLSAHGFILFNGALQHLHPIFIFLLAIFFGDFIAYFRHRLEHTKPLWPTHVMHHSDTDLNWLTVYRFHPLNRLTTVLIDGGCLVLLGFPPWAVAVNSLFRNYYGMLIHWNVPWTFGKLGTIFVSPAMHRWHHVREGEGVGSNFASVFAVFDRLFRTFYLPGPCEKPLGVPDVDNDAFLRQLAHPFTALATVLTRRAKPLPHG